MRSKEPQVLILLAIFIYGFFYIFHPSIANAGETPSFIISLGSDINTVLKDRRFTNCKAEQSKYIKNLSVYNCSHPENYIENLELTVVDKKVAGISGLFSNTDNITLLFDNQALLQKLKEKNFALFNGNPPEQVLKSFEAVTVAKGTPAEKLVTAHFHAYENSEYRSTIMIYKSKFKSDGSVNLTPVSYSIWKKSLDPISAEEEKKKKQFEDEEKKKSLESQKKKYNF